MNEYPPEYDNETTACMYCGTDLGPDKGETDFCDDECEARFANAVYKVGRELREASK